MGHDEKYYPDEIIVIFKTTGKEYEVSAPGAS
jgi:hypothetical protein